MARLDTLKILLISSGVVAVALAMKLSVPVAMEFVSTHVPVMCASFKSILRPPYIYVLINGIIITIAASSRFNHRKSSPQKLQSESVYDQRDREPVVHEFTPAVVVERYVETVPEVEVENDHFEDKLPISELAWTPPQSAIKSDDELPVSNSTWTSSQSTIKSEYEIAVASSTISPPLRANMSGDEVAFRAAISIISPPQRANISSREEVALRAAKPLVSSRFAHRKPIRSSPEAARPLRVTAKPKRHDTLDNTWKMITEGRSMPLSRHMKKVETWENQDRQLISVDSSKLDASAMVKSETLIDRTNLQPQPPVAVTSTSTAGPGGGKLKKEPSLSQDELNRRVEAFIKNFNEEMRLQRQESLNQYMEVVKRGTH